MAKCPGKKADFIGIVSSPVSNLTFLVPDSIKSRGAVFFNTIQVYILKQKAVRLRLLFVA